MGTITLDGSHGATSRALAAGMQPLKFVTGQFQFSDSYPTGGESLSLSSHLRQVLGLIAEPRGGYMFEYDYATGKLKAIYPRAAIESTLAVETPALEHAEGTTPVTSSAATMPSHAAAACTITGVAGVAAGPGAEVTAGVDLSAITVRFVAWGYA